MPNKRRHGGGGGAVMGKEQVSLKYWNNTEWNKLQLLKCFLDYI